MFIYLVMYKNPDTHTQVHSVYHSRKKAVKQMNKLVEKYNYPANHVHVRRLEINPDRSVCEQTYIRKVNRHTA